MIVTELSLYKIIFVIEIIILMLLCSTKIKRKKYFLPKLFIYSSLILLVAYIIPLDLPNNMAYTWWYSSLIFFGLFILCSLMLYSLIDTSWRKIFFICIVSYTTQHLGHELYAFIGHALNMIDSSYLGAYGSEPINLSMLEMRYVFLSLLYVMVHIVIFTLMYFIIGRKMYKIEVKVKNTSLSIIAAIILLVDVILNSLIVYNKVDFNKLNSMVICTYNLLSCFMVLYLMIYIIDKHRLEDELKMSEQLLQLSESRYEQSKDNMNLINLKCHDLKHQIHEYADKANISKTTVEELENMIEIYDSKVKTGNECIDLILTEKSLVCQKKNIMLTCLADCRNLSFISESDLYSLFGNAIDNAIEAVCKIKDYNKRSISVIVRNIHSFVSISIENYYEGEIVLNELNLPISTKGDNNYHGFGTKSIVFVANKYNGDVQITTNNHVFSLAILFPIPVTEAV